MKIKPISLMLLLLLSLVTTGVIAQTDEPESQTVHIVQANETLFEIAATYLGDGFRYPEIVTATQAEHLVDPTFATIQNVNVIEVGDKLLIPSESVERAETNFDTLSQQPLQAVVTPTLTVTPTSDITSVEATSTPAPIITTGQPTGKIAFSFFNPSPERCTYEINIIDVTACLTDATTCQATRRVFPLSNASEPALSPDGTRLAFRGWGAIPDEYQGQTHPYDGCSEPRAAERHVQTATLDGTDVRQITSYWEDGHADWSPDGSRLLFDTTRNGDGITRIMFMYSDTTGENDDDQKAADLRIAGQHPSWANDNDRFVYRGCDVTGNRCGLWLAQALPVEAWDLGINMLGPIIEEPQASQPDWSPVSEQIAYNAPIDGNWDIYSINADGSNQQRLTTDISTEGLPTWSPDGQWLAYLSDSGGSWGIWLMRPDGSDRRLLFAYDGGQYTLPREVSPYGSRNWYDEQLSWSQ